jgi:hypothetical protein
MISPYEFEDRVRATADLLWGREAEKERRLFLDSGVLSIVARLRQ